MFGSVLVVVAHPDDEAIAAGALLSRAPKVGVICASNGAPREAKYARRAGFESWLDYAQARRAETEAALALLHRKIAPSLNLGIADQDVALDMAALALHLVRPLWSGFSHVVTHAYEAGHPDHDAVAFGVHAACRLIARAGGSPPVIAEAPLYSAAHRFFMHQDLVPHDDAGPETHLELSPAEVDLKQRMFNCYVTQRDQFPKFRADRESFRLAPRYHFAAAPHPGPAGFDRYDWALTGQRWRRAAWQAMRELELLEELA